MNYDQQQIIMIEYTFGWQYLEMITDCKQDKKWTQ